MFKIIQTLALVIMIVLFPPAALITVSQGAVQGDATYPIKRWLEGQVLFLASFNPTTRALYAVAQANRRYEESAKLLSTGDDAGSTLQELVTQSNVAAGDINNLSNANEKSKLIADLTNSIAKYDQGLAQAQEQISRNTQTRNIQSTPTPQPTGKSTESPSTPRPSATQSTESTPAPSVRTSPTPRPTGSHADEEDRRRQEEIERARRELEELRRRLEEEKKKLNQANTAKQSSPTPTPTPKSSPSRTPTPTPTPTQTPRPSPSVVNTQDFQPAAAPAASPSPSPVSTNNPNDKTNFNSKWNKTDNDPSNDNNNGDDD